MGQYICSCLVDVAVGWPVLQLPAGEAEVEGSRQGTQR